MALTDQSEKPVGGPEFKKRRKSRSIAIAICLIALVAVVYLVTILQLQNNTVGG